MPKNNMRCAEDENDLNQITLLADSMLPASFSLMQLHEFLMLFYFRVYMTCPGPDRFDTKHRKVLVRINTKRFQRV